MTCELGKLWADARLTPRPFIMTHVQEDAPTYMKMLMVKIILVMKNRLRRVGRALAVPFFHHYGWPVSREDTAAAHRFPTASRPRECQSRIRPGPGAGYGPRALARCARQSTLSGSLLPYPCLHSMSRVESIVCCRVVVCSPGRASAAWWEV